MKSFSKIETSLLFLGIIFLTFALRWNSFTAPFERDEGEYAYDAVTLLDGKLPYTNSISQKPPMIFYTYAAGQLISPRGVWPPRLFAFIFIVLTAYLVALMSTLTLGKRAGAVGAVLFVLMINFPYLAPYAANTEIFAALPLTTVLYLYLRFREKASSRVLFLAGASAALALLYKPIVIYMLIFVFAVWLWEIYRSNLYRKIEVLKRTLAGAGGGLIVSVLALGYFAYRDGLKSFWECAVTFNAAYIAQFGFGVGNLLSRLQSFATNWAIVVLLTILFFVRPPRNWWWYAALLVLGVAAIYQTPIGHYYLILMPVWALIITHSVVGVSQFLTERIRRPVSFLVLASVSAILMYCPLKNQLLLSPPNLTLWIYGFGNPFLESEMAAQKLSEVTAPADGVFIAGSEPQILFYSGRRSVSRFVTTYALIMDTPRRGQYQKEAIAELTAKPPQAIVVSPNPESGLWYEGIPPLFYDYLTKLLKDSYQLTGGFVWTRSGGQWLDALSDDEVKQASLLLFRRL